MRWADCHSLCHTQRVPRRPVQRVRAPTDTLIPCVSNVCARKLSAVVFKWSVDVSTCSILYTSLNAPVKGIHRCIRSKYLWSWALKQKEKSWKVIVVDKKFPCPFAGSTKTVQYWLRCCRRNSTATRQTTPPWERQVQCLMLTLDLGGFLRHYIITLGLVHQSLMEQSTETVSKTVTLVIKWQWLQGSTANKKLNMDGKCV